MEQLGIIMKGGIYLDSSAARSIAMRKGVSAKIVHKQTKHLFIKGLIKKRRISLFLVASEENLADTGTKYLTSEQFHPFRKWLGRF